MRRLAMSAFRRAPRWLRVALVHLAGPSFTVGVVMALRRDDGRLLLVDQRHSGGWALPGGLLARGERAEDGLVREVAEEVGLTLDPVRLPVPFAAVTASVRRVDVVYVMQAGDDVEPRVGSDRDEVRAVGWFDPDALPSVTAPTLDILAAVRLR